jgi:kinesin family protein 18/19
LSDGEDIFCDQGSPGSAALESQTDLNTEDASTKEVTEAMWAGQSNILVAVRVRPLLSHDRQRKDILRVLDRKMVVVLDPGNKADVVGQMRNRTREKRYAFDRVFEPEEDQQMVYNETTRFLIDGVSNGFNATVFAYGCTGAGKTYTMLGTVENPGIMALTLQDMFKNIAVLQSNASKSVTYKVTVSFLEIYNENIRDLLTPSPSQEYLDLVSSYPSCFCCVCVCVCVFVICFLFLIIHCASFSEKIR